jgi:hypothetical protein
MSLLDGSILSIGPSPSQVVGAPSWIGGTPRLKVAAAANPLRDITVLVASHPRHTVPNFVH